MYNSHTYLRSLTISRKLYTFKNPYDYIALNSESVATSPEMSLAKKTEGGRGHKEGNMWWNIIFFS